MELITHNFLTLIGYKNHTLAWGSKYTIKMSSVMPLNFNAVDLHVAIIGGNPHVPEKCARQCCMKKHMSIPTMS